MVAVVSGLSERLRRSSREFFLLDTAKKTVAARTREQIATIRRYQTAAMKRLRLADELTHPSQAPMAMTLYREAAICFVAAMLIGEGEENPSDSLDLSMGVAHLQRLAEQGRIAPLPEGFEQTCEALAKPGRLVFDEVPAHTLRKLRARVESNLRWARSQVESRTLFEIRVANAVRLSVVTIIAIGLVYWTGRHFLQISQTPNAVPQGPNLALHKPVVASSVHPASTAPADNSGAVNGEIEPSYGVHTNIENNPWVTVDLQREYSLSAVRIYNRGDGLFDGILPVVLEISSNGTEFVQVERRTTSFSQRSPWIYTGHGEHARYVRVRCTKASNAYIALSEIEVYGKEIPASAH